MSLYRQFALLTIKTTTASKAQHGSSSAVQQSKSFLHDWTKYKLVIYYY